MASSTAASSSSTAASSSSSTAASYYLKGEELYNNKHYQQAEIAFSNAIKLSPDMHEAYYFRGICRFNLFHLEIAAPDLRHAVEFGVKNYKKHHAFGIVLQRLGNLEEAITQFEKAYDIVRFDNSTTDLVEGCWNIFAYSKYSLWQNSLELQQKEVDRLMQELEEANNPGLALVKLCLYSLYSLFLASLVPHYLQCPISRELFRDPVIAPSGASYERRAILDYIRKAAPGKAIDPSTRLPLRECQLYSNLALREAVDDFLHRNWWAYKVPHYLQCPISRELFRDPVIAPSGASYERRAILDYIRKAAPGKAIDPSTRLPLRECQLYNNLALREAVDDFLHKNWWAYNVDGFHEINDWTLYYISPVAIACVCKAKVVSSTPRCACFIFFPLCFI
ncbi:RING-type E3 ubiquitin transferase [Trifolium repens]|nr:RING-type E3 ubiquitin transferase [Trifolium repens]